VNYKHTREEIITEINRQIDMFIDKQDIGDSDVLGLRNMRTGLEMLENIKSLLEKKAD